MQISKASEGARQRASRGRKRRHAVIPTPKSKPSLEGKPRQSGPQTASRGRNGRKNPRKKGGLGRVASLPPPGSFFNEKMLGKAVVPRERSERDNQVKVWRPGGSNLLQRPLGQSSATAILDNVMVPDWPTLADVVGNCHFRARAYYAQVLRQCTVPENLWPILWLPMDPGICPTTRAFAHSPASAECDRLRTAQPLARRRGAQTVRTTAVGDIRRPVTKSSGSYHQ